MNGPNIMKIISSDGKHGYSEIHIRVLNHSQLQLHSLHMICMQ